MITYSIHSIPLDVAPMWHVNGELTREGFIPDPGDLAEWPESWVGCEVRVRARFAASMRAVLELAKADLLCRFAGAKRLQLELIAVPDAGLRAPAVAAAQTLRDKVEAWATASGTVLPALATDRLLTLETADAAAVTAAVQQVMGGLLETPAPVEVPVW